jgi:hypothetical protein
VRSLAGHPVNHRPLRPPYACFLFGSVRSELQIGIASGPRHRDPGAWLKRRRAVENCRRALTGEVPLHVIGLDERLM